MIKLIVNKDTTDLEIQGNFADQLIESLIGINALIDQAYNQINKYNLNPLYYVYCKQILNIMNNPSINNKITIDLSQLINNSNEGDSDE